MLLLLLLLPILPLMGGGTPVLTNVRAHQRSICLTNSCKLCYTFQRSARAHFNTASMMPGDASDDDDLNVSRCARARAAT